MRGVVGDGPDTASTRARRRSPRISSRPRRPRPARLALAEGLAAGITTVHDWAHNMLGAEDAEANVMADVASGARIHFSWGTPSTTPGLSLAEMSATMARIGLDVDQPMDLDAVAAWRAGWLDRGDGRLTIGVNLRGPARSTREVCRTRVRRGAPHGLPIAMHCAGTAAEVARIRQVQVLAEDGLLGPDLLLAHGNHLDATDIGLAAEAGCPISVSPHSELRLAMGWLRLHEFHAAGIRTSFSLDTTAIVGAADPFAAMRLAIGLEGVRLGDDRALSPQRALEMATIDGARSLGLDGLTGSLTPGKRADVIAIRTDGLSVAPVVDPLLAVVHGASPATVETVIADGRVLKRDGHLTHLHPATVVRDAEAALRAVRSRIRPQPGRALPAALVQPESSHP